MDMIVREIRVYAARARGNEHDKWMVLEIVWDIWHVTWQVKYCVV